MAEYFTEIRAQPERVFAPFRVGVGVDRRKSPSGVAAKDCQLSLLPLHHVHYCPPRPQTGWISPAKVVAGAVFRPDCGSVAAAYPLTWPGAGCRM